MRSIKILSAVIVLFISISCAGGEYGAEYENWFGYYSRYKGQTNHAYYNGYADAEVMAKKVVEGINTVKKLYNNSINALIPAIFLDIETYGNLNINHDNLSTCPGSTGYRAYSLSYLINNISQIDNATCYINYYNYCLNDSTSTTPRSIIVDYQNETARQRIWVSYNGSVGGSKNINYILEAKDINIKINERTGSDNMTIFGLVVKDAVYSRDNITEEDPFVTNKKITLRLDMPNDEENYRFDFYSDNSTLNFYHYQYGYVTVDISDFINSTRPIDERTKITMVYNENRKCTFSQEEFGNSNWFNCDDYPDYPQN